MSNVARNPIQKKLEGFKQRFYLNLLLKGSLLFLGCSLAFYTAISIAEYFGRFGSSLRTALFFSFLLLFAAGISAWVLIPLSSLLKLNKRLTDADAALRIGEKMPEINDKLLNTLQLSNANAQGGKMSFSLAEASIAQNSEYLGRFDFDSAVSMRENNKYLAWIAPVLLVFGGIYAFFPSIFTESTERFVNYDKEFKYAPFEFHLQNENLLFYKDEDIKITLKTGGNTQPQEMYLFTDAGRRLKMTATEPGTFEITMTQIQAGFGFYFGSAGYNSDSFKAEVVARPSLTGLSAYLEYPAYIKKNNERIANSGNLLVPQGTTVNWSFNVSNSQKMQLAFQDSAYELLSENSESFQFRKKIMQPQPYKIKLSNQHGGNKEPIEYFIGVIPDEYPSISLQSFQDTALFQYLIVGGNIADDYGISNLLLKYKINESDGSSANQEYKSKKIAFNPSLNGQNYFEQVSIADIQLQKGQNMEYYVEVWDNDQINGAKKTKSASMKFSLPSAEEISKGLSKQSENNEKDMNNARKKSLELQKQLEELENRLKGKKSLTWQDKKNLEELVEKNKALEKEIEKIQQQYKELVEKQNSLNQPDDKLSKKIEDLNKLMDSVLDKETKKLYEELEKLLQKEDVTDKLQETMKDIQKKEKNTERGLDKAMEMLKRLQVDQKVQEINNKLEKLAEKQEKLAEETKQAGEKTEAEKQAEKKDGEKKEGDDKAGEKADEPKLNQKESEELQQKQEGLNKEFEKIEKDFEQLEKMNEDLKNPKPVELFEEEQKQVGEEQEKSKEEIQKKDSKKASESQKKAAKKMEQMAQQMEESAQSGESVETEEDYEALRQILDNLIKLSFDQEDIMKNFREVKQVDPKFVELSQKQLKLQDDAKIIEDSLVALSKRVMQIESFITKELDLMNKHIDASAEEIKKRNPGAASGKQQMSMTSINNLALLLNDILSQMQMSMSQSMGGKQMKQKKPGEMSMGEMQQNLNKKIDDLKKSGKSGRQLSEELGRLAAEQEMLRNALKKAMEGQPKGGDKKGGKDGGKEGDGGNLSELMKKMEMTEEDLVNKRITEETIKRQKEILTRLLESEKAAKERDLDDKREAEKAKEKERKAPSAFSDYLKIKEKQIELLKSVPTSLTPFYKKEVNEYFNKFNSK